MKNLTLIMTYIISLEKLIGYSDIKMSMNNICLRFSTGR
jgi:hypothetical protein